MYRPKHVEWTCRERNSLHIVASVGHSIELIQNVPYSDRNGENVIRRVTVVFPTNNTEEKIFESKRDEVKAGWRKIHNKE